MIKKTIREYYLLGGLWKFSISVINATYVMFLQDKGLDLLEVSLVNFAYFFTLTIGEIPTGAFADVFGRKASFITSCALMSISMFVYSLSNSFWGFILAESIAAIGTTFSTGAFRAWFVDKLRYHGYQDSTNLIFARATLIKHGTGIIGALIGAFFAQIWLPSPWLIGACSFVLCALIALPLKEEYFIRKKFSFIEGFKEMKQTTARSFQYCRNDKKVRFILIMIAMQLFAIQAPNMQWQPLFQNWTDNKIIFGFIWTGIALSGMLGSWFAPKILGRLGSERKTLVLCQMLIGILIVASVLARWLPAVLFVFLAHEIARGAFEPVKDAYLHDNIPSKERATIESFTSIARHGAGMFGLLAIGILAVNIGIAWTWSIMGLVLVCATVIYVRNGKH